MAHLVVDPSKRNQGFGKILISMLEKEAKKFEYPIFYMRVNPENEQAINCYLKSGFELHNQYAGTPGNKWTWLKKEMK